MNLTENRPVMAFWQHPREIDMLKIASLVCFYSPLLDLGKVNVRLLSPCTPSSISCRSWEAWILFRTHLAIAGSLLNKQQCKAQWRNIQCMLIKMPAHFPA